MDKDTELFKGKTFADIMSDVYNNSKKKDRQLKLLIAQLEPLVKNLQDATVIVPLIKVGVPGACISSIDPFTESECCNSHWATVVSSASVILLTLLQLHSLARVRGQLLSMNSNARIVRVFICFWALGFHQ